MISREAATATFRRKLLSPLRGLWSFCSHYPHAYAWGYMLSPLRGSKSATSELTRRVTMNITDVAFSMGWAISSLLRQRGIPFALAIAELMSLSLVAEEGVRGITQESPAYRGLDANLYMQTSAEYRAICFQTFQLAERRLNEIKSETHNDDRRLTVVMDLDETVIDNSGFQSWMLRTATAYDQRWFDRWERWGGDEAKLVPGAGEFIRAAGALGFRIVHVSNRNDRFREQTKAMLDRLGIPIAADADLKLSTTTSDKTARRAQIEDAEKCRIVLLVGDNLRDFDDRFRSARLDASSTSEQLDRAIEDRKSEVDKTRTQWGTRWIVLPNPAYGEWTKPLGRGLQDIERMPQVGRAFEIAYWNVENLFDVVDDSKEEGDEEFTPNGPNKWTQDRLGIKLTNLSRVIKAMNRGTGPVVLGLAEVENRAVVEMLRKQLESLGRDYKIVHHDSPSDRGIDCALLYDAKLLQLEQSQFHVVDVGPTREIVEAEFSVGSRSFTVFVNHWPSRSHDESDRVVAAKTLRARVNALLGDDPFADLVVMGDFNDYPNDRSIKEVLGATGDLDALQEGMLFNSSSWMLSEPSTGTYVYDNQWCVLDQIILSPGMLLPGGISWALGSTKAAILVDDQLYHGSGGMIPQPSRSYSRTNFHPNGYSDHLPVVSTLFVAP